MKKKRVLWGTVILLLGVYMLASLFVPSLPNISVFKTIIAIGLISVTISSIPRAEFFGILMPIAIIVIMFKVEISKWIGISPSSISTATVLIATIFLCIGLNMLFGDARRKSIKKKVRKAMYINSDNIIDGEGVVVDEEYIRKGASDDSDTINCEVAFGSSVKYVDSKKLSCANLESSFGEMKVYFDKATPADTGLKIKVEVAFGNMVLYIPREWNVVNNIDAVLGAVKERGESVGNGPKVIITGDVAFGGTEIIYV